MIGIQIEKPWNIHTVELPTPRPKSGEALIRVKAVGICGSDIGAFRGSNPLVSYPRVIGHEIAGEILSVPAENTKGLCVGDHVIVDPYLYCGHCYPCSIGRTNCCEDLHVLGMHCEGGMVEYFTHPMERLVKLPADILVTGVGVTFAQPDGLRAGARRFAAAMARLAGQEPG